MCIRDRICNDLRWSNSGPLAGLAELSLPALQPGSSIMPGKINPVIPEAVVQACCQVAGLDAAIVMGASTSAFQLNTAMPLIGCNVVDQSHLIGASAEALLHLVPGITADPAKLRRSAQSSPAVATSLNLLVGYDTATAVVKEAETHGLTIRAAAQRLVDDGLVSAHDLEAALDIDQLAQGGHS